MADIIISIGRTRFGEYERIEDINYGIKILKIILNKIIKKETKILSSEDFWNYLVSKNRQKIDFFIKKFITKKKKSIQISRKLLIYNELF